MRALYGLGRWFCKSTLMVAAALMLNAYAGSAAASDWKKQEGDVIRYAGYTIGFAQDCGLDSSEFLPQVMLYIGWTTENRREAEFAGRYLRSMIIEGRERNGGSDWPCTVVKGALRNKAKQFAAANRKRISLGEGVEYNIFDVDPAALVFEDTQIAILQARAKKCNKDTYITIGHIFRVHMIYTATSNNSISERLDRYNFMMKHMEERGDDEDGACKSKDEEHDHLIKELLTMLDYIS